MKLIKVTTKKGFLYLNIDKIIGFGKDPVSKLTDICIGIEDTIEVKENVKQIIILIAAA